MFIQRCNIKLRILYPKCQICTSTCTRFSKILYLKSYFYQCLAWKYARNGFVPRLSSSSSLLNLCVSFRVHPEVRHGGGAKGAGGRRRRLIFWELHVRLFGGRGSGYGVVVKVEPPSPHSRLSFPKKSRNSVLYSYLNKTIFLQQHKDFYRYTRICRMILQNIHSYLGSHCHLPFFPPSSSSSSSSSPPPSSQAPV